VLSFQLHIGLRQETKSPSSDARAFVPQTSYERIAKLRLLEHADTAAVKLTIDVGMILSWVNQYSDQAVPF
jgi:hypothetical protein